MACFRVSDPHAYFGPRPRTVRTRSAVEPRDVSHALETPRTARAQGHHRAPHHPRRPHAVNRVTTDPGKQLSARRHAGRSQGGRRGAQARSRGSRDRGGSLHARAVPRDHRAPQRVRGKNRARARDARSSVRPRPRQRVFAIPTTAHRAWGRRPRWCAALSVPQAFFTISYPHQLGWHTPEYRRAIPTDTRPRAPPRGTPTTKSWLQLGS